MRRFNFLFDDESLCPPWPQQSSFFRLAMPLFLTFAAFCTSWVAYAVLAYLSISWQWRGKWPRSSQNAPEEIIRGDIMLCRHYSTVELLGGIGGDVDRKNFNAPKRKILEGREGTYGLSFRRFLLNTTCQCTHVYAYSHVFVYYLLAPSTRHGPKMIQVDLGDQESLDLILSAS